MFYLRSQAISEILQREAVTNAYGLASRKPCWVFLFCFVYHNKYLIIINKSLKLMVSLKHLQGFSFKHIFYNTWSPECLCVELQMNVVASGAQLMLFLIQIIACTTGSMPHERNYCNCHNKNNLTDCFFFIVSSP